MNILDLPSLKLHFPQAVFKKKQEIPQIALDLFPINHSSGFNKRTNDGFNETQITTLDSPASNIIGSEHDNNSTSSVLDEELEFPEGGLKAYSVVLGSFLGLVPAFGILSSIGAIETYVSTHQLADASTSTVSWIFSIFVFIASASGIFSGAFFDRNGNFPPMLIGTILFCGGLFAAGNSTTVYQFILSFGVVVGFGDGMLMSPLIGVVSHYFNKKRAIYTSIATIGGSVGGICFPLLLKKLYAEVGFAWTMRIWSFVCLFLLSISMVLSKGRLQKSQDSIKSPKDLFKVYILNIFDINSFKDSKFMFCSLAASFSESAVLVLSTYFPSYVTSRGFSESNAYLMITVISATGILGRYIPSYLADKYLGRFNVMIITLLLTAFVCLVIWLPFGGNLKVLYTFAALYGFFSGSIQSLVPVCAGQISKTSEFGRRYSTLYLFVASGSLGLIPAGGAIIGSGTVKKYDGFIIYSSLMFVAGAIFFIVSRNLCVGLKMKKF